MASEKVYGRDGPPQLRRRVEDIPLEDVPKFYGEEGLLNWNLSVPEWWGKRIRCTCGAFDAFEVLTGTSDLPGWVGGKPYGHQRCDLRCTRCGDRFLFFDDGVHGWNAVIADERATLPPNYLESNAKILEPFACDCGGRLFSIIAEVQYDCGEGIEEIPQSKWDDAYGSFGGTARCVACGSLHGIAGAETA
jgi:hypothetical protein